MYRSLTAAGLLIALVVAATAQVDAPPPVAAPPAQTVPEDLQDDLAVVADPEDDVRPSIRRGKAFVVENCAGCHSVGAYGESPNKDAPAFRTVLQRYAAASLEESLAEGIMTGHPEMPQFVLDPDEISDVVAYLDAVAVVTGK